MGFLSYIILWLAGNENPITGGRWNFENSKSAGTVLKLHLSSVVNWDGN